VVPSYRPGLPEVDPPRRARVATAATFVAQGLMLTALLTHLPQFTDRYDLSEGAVTLLVLMITVLAGVGSLLSERLAAATSSRTALRGGLLTQFAAASLIGVAPGIAVAVAGFAVYGLGLGAVDAAGNMQAVAVQHRYGRSIITSLHAAWSAGAIGAALYVAGGERIGVPLSVSVLGASGTVLAVVLAAGPYLLPPEADPEAPYTDPGADPEPAAPLPAADRAAGRVLLGLGLAMTCFWAVDSGVSNWGSLYLRDGLSASGSTAALGYAFYQGAGLTSRLAGDRVVRRLGPVTTVRAASLIGTAGLLAVVLAPSPVVAIAGFTVAGLGLPVIAPLCFGAASAAVRGPGGAGGARTAAERARDDAAVDRAVARLNVFNYLGSLLGAVLVGVIVTVADLRTGFVIPVVLAAAVVLLARAFAPDRSPG
jgi:Major Facilitator Superfamily